MWSVDEAFILDVKIASAIQELRVNVGNRIYSYLVEGIIRSHEDYGKLLELRKTGDPKEAARFAKKLLAESLRAQGLSMEDFRRIYEENKRSNPIYVGLLELEKQSWKRLAEKVRGIPLYSGWLRRIRGINVVLACQLIAAIRDIRRFPNPSKLRKYLGTAPGLRKQRGLKSPFNPKFKGLMLGKVAECLLRANSQYKRVYDEKKAKYIAEHPDWTKMKCHRYALKAMVNRFIAELWAAWYKSLGLEPPAQPYPIQILGHQPEPPIVPYTEESHSTDETQLACASHCERETHAEYASHNRSETQTWGACFSLGDDL